MENSLGTKINWRLETVPPTTLQALEWLSTKDWLKNSEWYLAGGTALALQVGHRQSVDLDFFTHETDFNSGRLLKHFQKVKWQTTVIKEGTIYGELYNAKVSFIAYPFFVPTGAIVNYGTIRILPPEDIAVMKVIAISQRGRKRDFYDLYWYIKNRAPLFEIVLRLSVQYPNLNHNYHHIVKSLTYFADADKDPEPKLFFKASWPTVKRFFKNEVKTLAVRLKLI